MPADPHSENEKEVLDNLSLRLSELNYTSGQVLLFLSFAIVAAVTFLAPGLELSRRSAVSLALRWWIGAIFPTVIGMIPLKEMRHGNLPWYRFLLWKKLVLLCSAITCIFIGAVQFYKAI
jgi:hypothetical protein